MALKEEVELGVKEEQNLVGEVQMLLVEHLEEEGMRQRYLVGVELVAVVVQAYQVEVLTYQVVHLM